MKIKQRLLKFIMITAIPLFCISCAVFGVALALKSVNVEMDGMFNYTVPIPNASDFSMLEFTYDDANLTATVAKNPSNEPTGDLAIPAKVIYNGEIYSVTSIGDFAFEECYALTSITIPNGVTSIGDSAFEYCDALTSIDIPDSVESIGDFAFDMCEELTSIDIPDSVESIGENAFTECYSLTSITIPASVTSIGDFAFESCTGLTSINVYSGNMVYHSAGNCLIETASKELLQGCKTSVIPNDGSVTSIGNRAFSYCTGLTSITIPSSVTSIGDSVFRSCKGLTKVTIPEGVTSIGDFAFESCTGLTSITIPSSVKSINDNGNAFLYCSNLAIIYFNGNVPSTKYPSYQLGAYGELFSYALAVYIKEGYTAGDYTTAHFTQIISDKNGYEKWYKKITATGISNVYFEINNDGAATAFVENAQEVDIPEKVVLDDEIRAVTHVKAKDTTGSGSTTLKSVKIPSSVTSIGWGAFYMCTALTYIRIPSSVTSIGDEAFRGCSSLTSITIPNSVTSIGVDAFAYCEGLTSITIPSSVTNIGNHAFYILGLTQIYIDSNIIANALTSSTACGDLIAYVNTVYIKEGCSTSSSTYLTSKFTQTTSDKTGYVKWTRS